MEYLNYANAVYDFCENSFKEAIQYGAEMVKSHTIDEYKNTKPFKIEYAVNSRYLHRGYYCPSPVLDKVLVNSRRGYILEQVKNRRFTHRYYYNHNNKLYMIEYFVDGISDALEYIVYVGNKVLGLMIDNAGFIHHISVEEYNNNRLIRYVHSRAYTLADDQYHSYNMCHERYSYDKAGRLRCFDFDFILLDEIEHKKNGNAHTLVTHHNYDVIYEGDMIIDIK